MHSLRRLRNMWREYKMRCYLARQEKIRQQRYKRWQGTDRLRLSQGLPHQDRFEELWREGVPYGHYFPNGPDMPMELDPEWFKVVPMPKYDPDDTEECDLCGQICSCLNED